MLCVQPLPESVALVEDIVVEYVTDLVSSNSAKKFEVNSPSSHQFYTLGLQGPRCSFKEGEAVDRRLYVSHS